ncbi:uncharacterized protein [Anabrus simplex]|uniref:uncharacterized protein isoform X2 n=1 Tax=Anabrus simplex TaxID=316456 RepID=UPI0035A30A54
MAELRFLNFVSLDSMAEDFAKMKVNYAAQVVTLQGVGGSETSDVFDIEQDIEEVLEDEGNEDGERDEDDHDHDEDGIEFEEEITYSMKIPENSPPKFQKLDGPATKIIVCPTDDAVETVKNTWTRDMTHVLIEEYRKMKLDFQDPYKKQKDLWIKLAENMCHRGCDVTWDMCDQKWRNLKHTFKSIYYNTHRSERSKRRWDFYESLEGIFIPILVSESMRKNIVASPSHSQDEDSNTSLSRTIEISELSSRTNDIPKKIRPKPEPEMYSHIIYNENSISDSANYNIPTNSRSNSEDVDYTAMEHVPEVSESPPRWFQDFMNQYREDESRRLSLMKQMHSEMLQVERRKCEALEALLKKLTK